MLFASHPGGMASAWLRAAKLAAATTTAPMAAHWKYLIERIWFPQAAVNGQSNYARELARDGEVKAGAAEALRGRGLGLCELLEKQEGMRVRICYPQALGVLADITWSPKRH
jgi:hypothetical protein